MKHKKERDLPQRISWIIAAIVSLLMHGGLLLLVSQSAERPRKSSAATNPADRNMAVRVIPESSDTAQAQRAESIFPSAENSAAAIKPSTPESLITPNREPSSGRPKKLQISDLHFFDIDEVDQPALPALDWNFPEKIAASLGLRRLVIEIWIAEDGRLLDMNIISSRPEISRRQQAEIMDALIQTKMTPATRQGLLVPSRRVLEMGFNSESNR